MNPGERHRPAGHLPEKDLPTLVRCQPVVCLFIGLISSSIWSFDNSAAFHCEQYLPSVIISETYKERSTRKRDLFPWFENPFDNSPWVSIQLCYGRPRRSTRSMAKLARSLSSTPLMCTGAYSTSLGLAFSSLSGPGRFYQNFVLSYPLTQAGMRFHHWYENL